MIHGYNHWPTPDMRPQAGRLHSPTLLGRRSVDGGEHIPYTASTASIQNQFSGHITGGPSVIRPTSSLEGAMDESAISSFRAHQMSVLWDTIQQVPLDITPSYGYPGFESVNNCSATSARTTTGYICDTPSRNHSPESLLSVSSSSSQKQSADRFQATPPHSAPDINTPSYNQASPSGEFASLRERIRELEHECRHAGIMIRRLRRHARPPHSPGFQGGWDTRTEARKKVYCSLNRAGNALCAWHDSRRERRIYPPRNAPPGYLNCGCTYEEALFEESLSRHGVGSYHPGEAVRMDPALRNPLLQLLKRRYGYKDGDFELDPVNEEWMEGQSPEDWQHKAREGRVAKTKN